MPKPESTKTPRKPVRKTVPLSVRIPDAREVVLTGEFTGWAKDRIRLSQSADGRWIGTADLAPGDYQYRLLVDGEWRDDPDAQVRVPNSFGTTNCILKVS